MVASDSILIKNSCMRALYDETNGDTVDKQIQISKDTLCRGST